MSIIKLNSENFENEVLNYEGKVLIDFYADWCGPCRMLAPVIEDIAEERSDVKVCKINVDDENALAMSFQISSIPTIVIIEGGKIKERFSRVKPMEDILALL